MDENKGDLLLSLIVVLYYLHPIYLFLQEEKARNGATSAVHPESPSEWIVANKDVLKSQDSDRLKTFRNRTAKSWNI